MRLELCHGLKLWAAVDCHGNGIRITRRKDGSRVGAKPTNLFEQNDGGGRPHVSSTQN